MTRVVFDAALRAAAVAAGAVPCHGRADRPLGSGTSLEGFAAGGDELRADFVIGADGATSHVARSAGLVEDARVLWGFAVRCYLEQPVDLPVITLWEQTRWRAFPGTAGSSPDRGAAIGVGIGTLADRQGGAVPCACCAAYLDTWPTSDWSTDPLAVRCPGSWAGGSRWAWWAPHRPRGGFWSVMPQAGQPLQGEGIAQAMSSGRAAAESILGPSGPAATTHRRRLARAHLPDQRISAAGHAALVGRPGAVSAAGRLVTAPLIGRALAGDGGSSGTSCSTALLPVRRGGWRRHRRWSVGRSRPARACPGGSQPISTDR